MRNAGVGALLLLSGAALAATAAAVDAGGAPPRVSGIAVLPAATWSTGPPCGGFDDLGRRRPEPRFPRQPVQGFSSLRPGPSPGTWWGLVDNGFGSPANSSDFLLRLYLLRPRPRTSDDVDGGEVTVERVVELADPDALYPWRLVREDDPGRRLTGADLDPESLVATSDGGFWIGDELGPFLLHFDADGSLAEPPFPVPTSPGEGHPEDELRSPNHPELRARGVAAGEVSPARVPASGGFEGLALAADGRSLLALLEKTVAGDPPGLLRLYRFDLERRSFTRGVLHVPLEDAGHRVGEIAVVDSDRLLIVERDRGEGPEARFKRVYELELDAVEASLGTPAKRLLIDLMNVPDPDHLAGPADVFTLPYATIESLHVVAPDTVLVANDNNFPAAGARGAGVPNATELVWIRLGEPLVIGE